MPQVDDKGTTRRFTPEMAMKIQARNHELEDEVLRLKALNSTQLDTYQNMFDCVVVERKYLIQENVKKDMIINERNKSIANRDVLNGSNGKTIQCLRNEVKGLIEDVEILRKAASKAT